ncbi:MAG TPA: YdeI/OmpD-associated family protein [Marmoricola sp.]|nr:YdeI/OmpD-associated family protein [Marmoricola sp.]
MQIGENSHPLRLAVMGGENLIGFSKAARAAFCVEIGDVVDAVISLDEVPREVAVPTELQVALASDAQAAEVFAGLAFTHRKEYAVWVSKAKQQPTRDRRAAQAIEMQKSGRTRS